MVYKHAVGAAFRICARHGEVVAKREVGVCALNSHGNYIVDHEKSWNCVFEFLWEPCLGLKWRYMVFALLIQPYRPAYTLVQYD